MWLQYIKNGYMKQCIKSINCPRWDISCVFFQDNSYATRNFASNVIMRFPIQIIIYVHSKKLAGFGFRNTLIINFDIDCFILRFSPREYHVLGLFKFNDNLFTLSHWDNSASSLNTI